MQENSINQRQEQQRKKRGREEMKEGLRHLKKAFPGIWSENNTVMSQLQSPF